MALPPAPPLSMQTWLDRQRARRRRGRRALASAAIFIAIAAAFAVGGLLVPAGCAALIAAFDTFVAIGVALPRKED